jgi:membrane protein DedA with SNARE-associated domain
MLLQAVPSDNLTGLVGIAFQVMDALGEVGVGLLSLIETAIPFIPSEVILPLAGFVSRQGAMSFPLVLLLSVVGAVVGALVLYAVGYAVGIERATRILSRIPLLTRRDVESATGWFERHGRKAVFFARLIPGVRALISLPAGADRMNLAAFVLLTAAGSAIWNTLLIGLGYLLGSQYELVKKYADYINYSIYGVVALIIVVFVVRRIRRGPEAATTAPTGTAE